MGTKGAYMDNTDSIGASRLREWIDSRAGYTQAPLAEDLNISAGMVSHLVTGRARPSTGLACLLQARTGGAVKVTDWLDEHESFEYEVMSRLVGRADG